MDMKIRIDALMTGRARPFGPNGEMSATRKSPVDGPVRLTELGLDGDEHTDPNHGGREKALLHYAAERYEMWAEHYPGLAIGPGGFGENITTRGMTEETVCVGDRYRIGSDVLVEVTQPRQPCWKLSHNAGVRKIAAAMQEHAAPGWYYSVLIPGTLTAGDRMELVERPLPEWTLARLIRGFYATPLDTGFLEAAKAIDRLGVEWRSAMERRLASATVERWHGRLYGPL
jgi:MOSC domain-containing protein YiiM